MRRCGLLKRRFWASQSNDFMGYFLPYQERWLADDSRFKIAEKSRRVGLTYAQSYEDVRDASRQNGAMDVWFSSADESAAKEYILYCTQWAKLLNVACEDLGEQVIDSDNDIKALVIRFSTGKRIHALSSNPKGFRSKGGKLVLDEFAFHGDQEAMWKAARPVITWGFPVRIISTYNGKGNRYHRMVGEAKKGNGWTVHTITIEDAVADGLADKIAGRKLSDAERAEWVAQERATVGDEDTWQQEYMCNPVDEASAWLPYGLISSCEHEDAGKPELYEGGPCYSGEDIGLRNDLWVMWIYELVGDVLWTREIITLHKVKFAEHDAARDDAFKRYRIVRHCMDQTGMGEKPVEDAKADHGEYTVEGILLTAPNKQMLATDGKRGFEDRTIRIPASDSKLRADLHKLRLEKTAAGNPRFAANRDADGHADRAWACFLGIHAADTGDFEYHGYESVDDGVNWHKHGGL